MNGARKRYAAATMTDQARATRAQDEAAEWFARMRRQSVSAQSLRDFREWRRDETNAAAFAQVQSTWETAGELANDPDIQAATDKALEEPTRSRATLPPARVIWTGLGALFIAVLLSSGWMWWQARPTWSTGVGEQRRVVLADGSRVRLNTDSAVRVRFADTQRRLELVRGEAFFEVAHDAARPFTVSAGDARIRALGTQFDVRRDGDAVRVSLVQGRVQVGTSERPQLAVLTPNQALTIRGGAVSAAAPTTLTEAAGWTTGRLTFRETPLAAAVAEANRYSRKKVRIDGPASLDAEPVSGVFDAGDTEAFAAALQGVFGLQVAAKTDTEIRLAPQSADAPE